MPGCAGLRGAAGPAAPRGCPRLSPRVFGVSVGCSGVVGGSFDPWVPLAAVGAPP